MSQSLGAEIRWNRKEWHFTRRKMGNRIDFDEL